METDAPSFAELGLHKSVLKALTDLGYESPSPVQAQTIPSMLAGRHVVGLAQTGTGKTAAFALPILSRIDPKSVRTQALILAPTRELALQVAEAVGRYAHYLPDVHVLPVYGGQSYTVQLSGLRRGAQVVVGTPGRVIDHLNRGTLDLSGLAHLVLDEADEMLRMGFQEDVEAVLASTPASAQIALFSATMPAAIRKIAKRYLTDAAEITVQAPTVTAAKTRQRYLRVAHPYKLEVLTRLLEVEQFDGVIVFVRTKSATEDLAERLRGRGFAAAAINGDLIQAQRERTIGQLRSGDLDILVATDVAARGLDVERITHVVNYDIPHDTESYVHRIGRTGRAGRRGEAILFVTARERHLLAAIEKATRQKIAEMPIPSIDDVNSQRLSRFRDLITETLASPELARYREIVGDYARDTQADLADIGAALALMASAGDSLLLPAEHIPAPAAEAPRPTSSRAASGASAPKSGKPGTRRDDFATYRISVGRRQKVNPSAIVGALANEGGLVRGDFGAIEIKVDHSLVELPATLSKSTLKALSRTRISGQLIELTRVDGRPERPQRKPRHDTR